MRSWRQEWQSAQLRLELRSNELFQGETVALVVRAEVPVTSEPFDAVEQRWRAHCEGAQVAVKIVDDTAADAETVPDIGGSSPPLSPPVFHQEARLTFVPHDKQIANDDNSKNNVVIFQTHVLLKVRSEYVNRPLRLLTRITPHSDTAQQQQLLEVEELPLFLTEQFTQQRVLRLVREQTTVLPTLSRRLEPQSVRVVRPLQLQVQTKYLSGCRVAIIARTTNTHAHLSLNVLDLQLHLNDSSRVGGGRASLLPSQRFRVIAGGYEHFPVLLCPKEQYNSVFMLEMMERGESEVIQEERETIKQSKKMAKQKNKKLYDDSHQTLLTLTWQAVGEDENKEQESSSSVITEYHTVIWSPTPHVKDSQSVSSSSDNNASESMVLLLQSLHLIKPNQQVSMRSLEVHSPLCLTLMPAPPEVVQVGHLVTLCVVVTNRSPVHSFDLTLVLPGCFTSSRTGSAASRLMDSSQWVGFESCHELGLVRPGMVVRKSVRVVFLCVGACTLRGLSLFDALTPTLYAAQRPVWEVIVRK